jgi:hypothetical protein
MRAKLSRGGFMVEKINQKITTKNEEKIVVRLYQIHPLNLVIKSPKASLLGNKIIC